MPAQSATPISFPAVPVVSLIALCAVAITLTSAASSLAAQQIPSTRLIYVNISDPKNRSVSGLQREHFQVRENGVAQAITSFLGVDAPMSLTIVTAEPVAEASRLNQLAFGRLLSAEDELISARSFSDALKELTSSKNPRKIVIVAVEAATQEAGPVPGGIQVVRTDPGNLLKTVIEV